MCSDTSQEHICSLWARRIQAVTSVLANIAVILGIVFAVLQLVQTRSAERHRIAIEATAPLRSPKFLDAYTKVTDAARGGADIRHAVSALDDLYYVVSVYDNIALMYVSGLADKQLIRNETYNRLKVLMPIMQATGWPSDEERKNIDALAKAFQLNSLR